MVDSFPDLKELLQNRYDAYLIEALHMVIHELDVTYVEFKEITESDFDSYVEEQQYKRDSEYVSEETSDSHVLDRVS
jgi:hypothetical protein